MKAFRGVPGLRPTSCVSVRVSPCLGGRHPRDLRPLKPQGGTFLFAQGDRRRPQEVLQSCPTMYPPPASPATPGETAGKALRFCLARSPSETSLPPAPGEAWGPWMSSRGSWPDAYPWACGGASTQHRAVDGQTHLTFPTDCPEASFFPSESLRPAGLVGNCFILQLLPKGGGKTVPQGMEVIRNKDPLRGHHASWFAASQMKGQLGYVPA